MICNSNGLGIDFHVLNVIKSKSKNLIEFSWESPVSVSVYNTSFLEVEKSLKVFACQESYRVKTINPQTVSWRLLWLSHFDPATVSFRIQEIAKVAWTQLIPFSLPMASITSLTACVEADLIKSLLLTRSQERNASPWTPGIPAAPFSGRLHLRRTLSRVK